MQTDGDTTHEENFVPISEPLDPPQMLEALRSISQKQAEPAQKPRPETAQRHKGAPGTAQQGANRGTRLASFRDERKQRAETALQQGNEGGTFDYSQWAKRLGLLLAASLAGMGAWYLVSEFFLGKKGTGRKLLLAEESLELSGKVPGGFSVVD